MLVPIEAYPDRTRPRIMPLSRSLPEVIRERCVGIFEHGSGGGYQLIADKPDTGTVVSEAEFRSVLPLAVRRRGDFKLRFVVFIVPHERNQPFVGQKSQRALRRPIFIGNDPHLFPSDAVLASPEFRPTTVVGTFACGARAVHGRIERVRPGRHPPR